MHAEKVEAGTTEFFDELGRRGHEPLLETVTGTLRFELADGKRTDRWLVAIKQGDVAVSRRNGEADCVVRADRTFFDSVAGGETNVMAALLRGEMGVQGSVGLLVAFQRLFPSPPSRSGKRRAAGNAGRRP